MINGENAVDTNSKNSENGQGKLLLHDNDIREPLFDFLEETYGKVRIIEEKVMGDSRADVVMITEKALVGIEIKSDADTYARLARQVKDYDRYFDMNICVVGTKHAVHIREHVPEYWGIITVENVDNIIDFYVLREPGENPELDWVKKVSVLWRPEMAQLQELNGMPKYKEKSRDFVARKIVEMVPNKLTKEELTKQICERLFERDYTKVEETLRDYRRSETEKLLEKTTDPTTQIELMMNAAVARSNLKNCGRKRRSRRR